MSSAGVPSGFGTNPIGAEADAQNSHPRGGVVCDIPLTIDAWLLTSGAQLGTSAATNAPYRAAVQGSILGVRWDNTVTTGSVMAQTKLPGEFDPSTDELILIPTLRYSGSGSDVTTLTMQAKADYFQPGHVQTFIDNTVRPVYGGNWTRGETTIQTMDPTVTTAQIVPDNQWSIPRGASKAKNLLLERPLGVVSAASVAGFVDVAFNFSLNTPGKIARGSSDINVFKPLSIVALTLTNSASPGANNNIDMIGAVLRIRRNLSLNRRDARTRRDVLR